jgi:hypothetical protein
MRNHDAPAAIVADAKGLQRRCGRDSSSARNWRGRGSDAAAASEPIWASAAASAAPVKTRGVASDSAKATTEGHRSQATTAERDGCVAIEKAEATRDSEPESPEEQHGKVLHREGKGENDAAGRAKGSAERQGGAPTEGVAQEGGRQAR